MKTPLLDLEPIHKTIREDLRQAVLRVLDSNQFIGGPEIDNFESEIASYCGVKHAVGVSSGTDALLISLMALNVGPGTEVIVPAYTFFSTAGSVSRLGAKPIFCDIDPITFNIDVNKLKNLISPKTRAIIPVHLFGQCAPMAEIMAIAEDHGLYVIEDAAQAIGAKYKSKMAGVMGTTGCLSFFPSKNLGGIGDGGLVMTNDDTIYDLLVSLRQHGATKRYFHTIIGGNFRLDAIQAAALRIKLTRLNEWSKVRRENARYYKELLKDLESNGFIKLPVELQDNFHVYNQFVIRASKRDALQSYLSNNGVGSAIYYPLPLHLQECFKGAGLKKGTLPESEMAANETLAIPIFPGLTEEQMNLVVMLVYRFYGINI
ncbi:MAG: DegT/DnrJ/EryC1/StrS family aminotransferase [Deltaproteobacteria bacterium]|nr:DegT/DnrJ/EryC1/StrS family aminotransferase [Deltaproteobacteria bacterium]